ncbi:MAG: IS1634 family transposase [Succinivibrio sp.]|nr:IS1634 family transposase [Succinivibrio sp.]
MTFRLRVSLNKGRHYGAIVESIYNASTKKTDTVHYRSLGNLDQARADDPEFDKKLRSELDSLNSSNDKASALKKSIVLDEADNAQLKAAADTVPPMNYGIALYRKLWEKLGLDKWFDQYHRNHAKELNYDLDSAVFFLAANRLLHPDSKAGTYARKNSYIYNFSKLKLDDLYASLGVLAASKERIISNLNAAIGTLWERDLTLALYDVTTFYFESFDSDELRARGMSKENKTNEVQIVMGLLIDGDGIPLGYELFRGNESEMGTMLEIVRAHKDKLKETRITVVADRGLNSGANLAALNSDGFDFIVAQSISRLSKNLQDQVYSEDNWDTDTQFNEDHFKIKTLHAGTIPGIDTDLIVTWSLKRQIHDLKVLEERWQRSVELTRRGSGAVNASMKHGVRQFITTVKGHAGQYEPNQPLYEKRRKSAGFYALVTSVKNKSASEIYASLRQQWKIENCFRVMKSTLEARPVYVWTNEHIRGHFMLCYLALVLDRCALKLAQDAGIEISSDRLIALLNEQNLIAVPGKRLGNGAIIRTGHTGYPTEDKKTAAIKLIDEIMKIYSLRPINQIDIVAEVIKKLKVRLESSLR